MSDAKLMVDALRTIGGKAYDTYTGPASTLLVWAEFRRLADIINRKLADKKAHDDTANRFWEKVEKGGPDECWEWQGAIMSKGYGTMHAYGKTWRAHRLSWLLDRGADPGDNFVIHSCDNPPCVNPAHLSLGDHGENMKQRTERGRDTVGEKHGMAVLTEDDVRTIRERLANGDSCAEIARGFSVSREQISAIKHGKNWAHI